MFLKERAFNFSPGPSMFPLEVLQQMQEEMLNYDGCGAAIFELSHREKLIADILSESQALMRELLSIPEHFDILYVNGGGIMQMSTAPLNLIALKPQRTIGLLLSGVFANAALNSAALHGEVKVLSSSKENNFSSLPDVPDEVSEELSYVHVASNNTIMGTQIAEYPNFGVPLVIDATSDVCMRPIDFSNIGLLFAGFQKNIGYAGLSLIIVRQDLLGKQLDYTPPLLNLDYVKKTNCMPNTINTFALYTHWLLLKWMKKEGGINHFHKLAQERSKIIYGILDASTFYKGHAHKNSRSIANVVFTLPTEELEQKFIRDAHENGLISLKGHRATKGIRASMYNAMPLEGSRKLAEFMLSFEKENG